jgi:hypothetical protein
LASKIEPSECGEGARQARLEDGAPLTTSPHDWTALELSEARPRTTRLDDCDELAKLGHRTGWGSHAATKTRFIV